MSHDRSGLGCEQEAGAVFKYAHFACSNLSSAELGYRTLRREHPRDQWREPSLVGSLEVVIILFIPSTIFVMYRFAQNRIRAPQQNHTRLRCEQM